MHKEDTPINSTELVLKPNTTQSIIIGDSDDDMPQEQPNFFLRICKSDAFAVSAELLKTSKIAIEVPASSFQSGVLRSGEILRLIQEDVDDPEIPLNKLRYWDPKLSAFVKFHQSTKIIPGHFLMNCLDIVWEEKPKKEFIFDSSPVVPPLKQYFSMLEEGEMPISQKVFNLEYRLNTTDERVENLISTLAKEGIIVLNSMENQDLMNSDASMTTIKGLTPANRTTSAPGLIAINSSRLTLGALDSADQTLRNQHQMSMFDKKKLHFAILYSHPLLEVNMNPGGQKETFGILQNEPVNFSVECDSILRTIQAKKKMVNVHIESASQEKFIKMIRDKPTVLHVMCHGSYDNKTSEFFLEFENEYSALLRLTPKILRECLQGQDLSSIRLVFLNACHSEGVGRVFFEFGVKCLVVVNMNHKIDDEYATVFSNNFYSNLLEGQTIQSAFDSAKSDLRKHKKVHPGCCCHHDHQPWCLWAESLKEDGIERAHSKHEQICQCPHADLCIHKNSCPWKEKFEEIFEHPDHPNEFKVAAPQHKGSWRICCCRADLPHDESMKLMLLFNENKTEYGEECIFNDLRDGTFQQINKEFYQSVSFNSVSVIGQNKLLYSMIKHFFIDKARVLYICGPAGSGKSTICKAFSNFVQERHKFTKFSLKKLSSSESSSSLVSKTFGFVYLKDLPEASKSEEHLIIYENADAFIKEHPEDFDEQINEFVESTKAKFLIEITNRSLLEKRKKPRKYEYVLNVPGLKDLDAAKFVKNHLTSIHVSLTQWEKDIYNMKTLDVFQKEWTPKDLLDLAIRINTEKQDFKVICNNFLVDKQKQMALKPSQDSGPKDEEEEDRIIIDCLQEWLQSGKGSGHGVDGADTESLVNLLMIISCFPMGLFLDHYISIVQDGEFRTLLSLPSDYLVPIVLLSRMSPRELQNPNLDISEKEPAIVDHLMMGDEDAASQIVSNLVAYVGSGMYYLSTKYDKDDVLIMSHHGIRNHVRELGLNKEQLYTAFFVAFACYQNLFSKMIKIAKQECYCYEELVEYNSLCPSPAWDFTMDLGGGSDPIDQEYGPTETELDLFLKKQTRTVSGFKQLFTHYDSNLGVLLIDEMNFFSIPAMLEYASCCASEIFIEFVNLLEDTIIKMMTLNRICGEHDRCRDLSRHLLPLTKLEIGKKCLRRTIFKSGLQLGCAWLSELQDSHIETKSPEHKQSLAGNIETLTRNLEDLTQEKEYDVFACAVLTLQLNSSLLLSQFLIYTPQQQAIMMQNLFRHAEKLFKMDNGSGYSDYEHDWAKACLALIQCGFNFEEQNQMAADLPTTKQGILNRIEETFKVHNSHKLRCITLELLCLDHLQQNQYREVLDIAQKGVEVSTEFGLNTFDGRFRDIYSKAEGELKSQYENKFMFLIADPIIPPPEPAGVESPAGLSKTMSTRPLPKEWSPAKQFYTPGPEVIEKKVSFRKAILSESFLRSLKSLGKKITFHFDACTRKMLDLLYDKTEGAKVLVLHIEQVTNEYIVLEGPNLEPEKITIEEMKEINQNPELSLGVDVLILTGPRGELLARYFRESNVKYIVYFEIPERKSQAFLEENQYDFLTSYWIEKFKEEFISRFFERFSTGLDASMSLKQAKIRAVERITHMMTAEPKMLHKVELSSFKPTSATPIPIELDFEFNQNMIVIEESTTPGESVCRLATGTWFDCSPPAWKFKDKFEIPEIYIRRDSEILSIYHKLQKHERIQLMGDRGCGKSFVAALLQKELSLRSVYPDGVYYLDIANNVKLTHKDDNSLYPYLREVFQEDILNNDSLLANKKILLILDGYQRVVDKEIVKPTYLMECIVKYHTHAVFITPKDSFVPEANQQHVVQGFTPEESLACMLSLGIENSKFFFRLSSFSVEKLIRSDTMKEVVGNPAAIQAKAARFYDRELGVIWRKSVTGGMAGTGGGTNKLNNTNLSGSMMNIPNTLESWEYDWDDKSEISMILSQTVSGSHVNTSGGSNKASDKKGKKFDSKKDEKNPKQRKKVKDKKSMC